MNVPVRHVPGPLLTLVARWRAFVARSTVLSAVVAASAWAALAAGTLRPARALPYERAIVSMSTLQGVLFGALPLISGFVALQVAIGPLETARSRRRVIVLMLLASAVVQALEGAATSALELLLLSALVGLAPIEPLLESLFDQQTLTFDQKSRLRLLIGLAFTAFLALLDAGSPAAMVLFGVRWAFWGGAAITALLAVLAWASLPDAPPRQRVVRPPRRRHLPIGDRLLMWQALVEGTAYAAMTAPLALVLEHNHLLVFLWLFGFRRLVPAGTSYVWAKLATRPGPAGPDGKRSPVYRPAAPLGASILMAAPFAIWLWVTLEVKTNLLAWLFLAWAVLEVTRGFGQTTQRGLPKQAPSTFGGMVARTVLGIGIGSYVGLLVASERGYGVDIVVCVGLTAIEIAIGGRLSVLLATRPIVEERFRRTVAPAGEPSFGPVLSLTVDRSPDGPTIQPGAAGQRHPLTGHRVTWDDAEDTPVLRMRVRKICAVEAAFRGSRRVTVSSTNPRRVWLDERHLATFQGHRVSYQVIERGSQVATVVLAAWHRDHTERLITGWDLTRARPQLRRSSTHGQAAVNAACGKEADRR